MTKKDPKNGRIPEGSPYIHKVENLGWIAGVPWRSRQRQTRVGGGCQGENFPRQVSCKSCKVCILKLTPNEDMERQEGAGESVDIESKCHTHTHNFMPWSCVNTNVMVS